MSERTSRETSAMKMWVRLAVGLVLLTLLAAHVAADETRPPHDRLERQFAELIAAVHGKRVGLLTNPSGVDSAYRHLSDRLHAHPDVELVALFAPEHGIRGDLQAGDPGEDTIDAVTGLPVYSLYGPRRSPTAQQLATIDVLVFDIQDVGVRFYTRHWIMTYAMEACAAHGKMFVVFDRPNPIGLQKVEGAPIPFDAGLIGRKWPDAPFGVATRHGMTAGELATLVNEEWLDPKVDLTVIVVPDYTRDMTFEETGYPWVAPSPNMPTRDTAMVYPGMAVFEGTNLSEGRGTTRPFELVGAPWVDGVVLAERLNALELPGVRFRAAWFTPTFSKHAGQLCGGVQVHVTDPRSFDPVRTGLTVLKMCHTLYPGELSVTNMASRLMGVTDLHLRIQTEPVESIIGEWQANLDAFRSLRTRHLLYRDVVIGDETGD